MQRIMLVRSRSAIVCYQQLRYSPVAHTESAARCSSRWSASYDTRVTRAGTRVRLIGDGAVARGARAIAAAGARREGPRFPWCSHRGSARRGTRRHRTNRLPRHFSALNQRLGYDHALRSPARLSATDNLTDRARSRLGYRCRRVERQPPEPRSSHGNGVGDAPRTRLEGVRGAARDGPRPVRYARPDRFT